MEPYVTPKHTAGHVTVHIWAWVDGSGNGVLHRIHGRHTAAAYREMLDEVSNSSISSVSD